MKTKTVVLAILLILGSAIPVSVQKSGELGNGFTIGLSYHGNEFFGEDSVVNINNLIDGEFNDGLLGLNMQYLFRYNKLLVIAVDYGFL